MLITSLEFFIIEGPWEEHICGRPLGLRFNKEKKLLIADAYLGLFEFDFKTGIVY